MEKMNWIQRQSLKIAIAYIALAGLWIILSDAALLHLAPHWDSGALNTVNSIKGLAFVLVTAGLLYWMVRRSLTQQEKGKNQYLALIDHAPIAMLIHVTDRVQYANAAALRLFRAENTEQLIGCDVQQLVPLAFRNTMRLRIARMRETGLPAPPLAQELVRLDGSAVKAEVAALPVEWNGAPAIQVVINDLSEASAYAARLSHITTHDLLTDLPNRTLLHDRLSQEIIHARRIKRTTAVLVMDVARLQSVNDSYGFEAGDELLRALADNLREAVRPGDTVARIAGDQFAILLADLHDRSGLLNTIEKVRSSAAHTYMVADKSVYVTLHSGVAVWPGDGEDAEALLGNAVTACNRAKKSGSANTEFYAPTLSQISRQRISTELALIEAISERQFVLYFQPKVSARSGTVTSCEALIRWKHPQRGIVPPAEFIAFAEETGHIQQIGDWALREACRQMSLWQKQGLGSMPTAVNLSALQLRQPGLEAMVSELIHQYDLPPSSLELELTESMIAADTVNTVNVINQLQALGVKLSLDDFGTGYSSFSYLKSFHLDHLKIDMSFVHDIATSESSARITQAIITLGHGLDMEVIAEGVETAEQARLLESWGCDIFQGYYFGRPVDAAQFTRILEESGKFSWNNEHSPDSPPPA